MTRLKSKLLGFNAQKAVPTKIYSPANCEELRIPFKTDKIAKVVGSLAAIQPPLPRSLKSPGEDGEPEQTGEENENPALISGVLIQNDFKISLMAPEDLKEYAGLTTTTIVCRQHLTLSAAGTDLIRWALEGTFGAIKETEITDDAVKDKETNGNGIKEDADEDVSRTSTQLTVMECVNVLVKPGGHIEISWEGNVINDGIADAVLAVLFTVESSPAAVRRKLSQTQTSSIMIFANTLPQNHPVSILTHMPTPRSQRKSSTTLTLPPTRRPDSHASSFSSKHSSARKRLIQFHTPGRPYSILQIPQTARSPPQQLEKPWTRVVQMRLVPKTNPLSSAYMP